MPMTEEEKKKRRSERSKKHYEKNKELIRAQQKEYYAENREEIRKDQNSTYWKNREPGARELYNEDKERRRKERDARLSLPKRIHKTKEEIKREAKEKGRCVRALSFGVQVCDMPEGYEDILMERQNGMCYYCGDPLVHGITTHLDHLTPHSRGGPHSFDNVALSCQTCNLKKASLTEEEFATANKWDELDGFRFCRQCMRGLPLEEFHVSKARNNGRAATCKECCKKYADAHKANV